MSSPPSNQEFLFTNCQLPTNNHSQGSQFGLSDVEVVTATVDLDEVVSYRWVWMGREDMQYILRTSHHQPLSESTIH